MNGLDSVMVHRFRSPSREGLISQSDPLADTARMHLSHCQQLISLRLLVKFACYAFDTFKLPESHLAWAEGRWWKGENRGKGSLWTPTPPSCFDHQSRLSEQLGSCSTVGAHSRALHHLELWWRRRLQLHVVWLEAVLSREKANVTDISLHDEADAESRQSNFKRKEI